MGELFHPNTYFLVFTGDAPTYAIENCSQAVTRGEEE